MTRDEWTQLSRQVSVAWPDRPLGPAEDDLFYEVLRDLSQEQVANGILRLVHDGVTNPPGPGELYRVSQEVAGIASASAPAAQSASSSRPRLVVDVSHTPNPAPAHQPTYPRVAPTPTAALMSGRGEAAVLAAPAGTGAPGSTTAAMILGIVGLLVPICALIAIVFGAIGIRDANRLPGQPGKGQAIAGLVLGIVVTAIWVWLIIVIASAASTAPTYGY